MMKSILSFLLTLTLILFGTGADASITQVTSNSHEDRFPRIGGDQLVWQGYVGSDWEIFLYDIPTGETTQITNNEHSDLSPQTDGQYVVWQGFNDGEWDIFLWDGTQIISISDRNAEDTSPQIADGHVVWTSAPFGDDFVGHSEVVLYDAIAQNRIVLSASIDPGNALDDGGAKINEDVVIWLQADDQDNVAVYMYDLDSETITKNPDYIWKDSPNRDGAISLLTRYDGQDREIIAYNNSSRKHYPITDNTLQDSYPSISKNCAVWMGGEGTASEIFLLVDVSVVLCADAGGDTDEDGVCGDTDNCPDIANTNQADSDSDGTGDVCDVCPNDPDDDIDGDNICGDMDNCPAVANAGQADSDGDGVGDACDADGDGGSDDGVPPPPDDDGGGSGCFIDSLASQCIY
jgi:beta propeller repeat protein